MFLKTTMGRGIFDIICSFMFIITGEASVVGYIMMGVLQLCGVFFIVIACACKKENIEGADYDSASI